jgi:hypothetical protein
MSNPYAAWADWLAAFGRGADLPATNLAPVADGMGPTMQARILHRLNEAFVARQQLWITAFQRDLDVLGPASLATSMVAARARLRPVVELTRSELLPEPVRTALGDALAAAVRETQNSLLDDVREHTTELAVVRDNDLTAALTAPSRVDEPESRPSGRTIMWR